MSSNISERDRILLGYAPGDPFGSSPVTTKTSDVDFSDVFGGPPRRSRVESLDTGSWRGSGSGLGERPVFGEVNSPVRRRHLKDDFFSDIFQSGESASSSPRRMERDSFNSLSPGSRVLSPTRPLPPLRSEAVSGGLSPPAQLSQSTKLARMTDHLMSSPSQRTMYKCEDGFRDSIPSSPTASVPSYTNRAVTAYEGLKTDCHVLYCQSPLSRQVSHSTEKLSEVMDSSSLDIKSRCKNDSTSLESYIRGGRYHFSIYKWAGKGATLVMPCKSNLQHESRFSRFRRLPEIVLQEVDVILHEDDMSVPNSAYQDYNLDKSVSDIAVETKISADSTTPKGVFPSKLGSKFVHSDVTQKSDDMDICNNKIEEVSVTINEATKHEVKKLKQLFDDDLEKQQNEEITRQVEGTEDFSSSQQKVHANKNNQQVGREHRRNPVKVSSPKVRDASVAPDEKIVGIRVKEKVKNFIKIFNQDDSQKRKGTFETPGRMSRGKDEEKGNLDDRVFVSIDKTYEHVRTTSRSYGRPETLSPINQNSEMSEKVDFNISSDVHMVDDSLPERKDPLRPFSDSTSDILDASVSRDESYFDDLEGCLIELISPDGKQVLKSDSDQDLFKSIDAKVQEWSKGKEGNIRSLLSTLQYVLWPESGWKPVPLVDIIEGASVKRAYQKALLCLHPDKLLQKGAAPHQKYIAEKVFDIMQESWDHFNSSNLIY